MGRGGEAAIHGGNLVNSHAKSGWKIETWDEGARLRSIDAGVMKRVDPHDRSGPLGRRATGRKTTLTEGGPKSRPVESKQAAKNPG